MLNLLLGQKKFSNPKKPGTIPETCNIRKLKYIYTFYNSPLFSASIWYLSLTSQSE